jgi:hypothetical protein
MEGETMTLVDKTPPYCPYPMAAEIIHRDPDGLSGLDKLSHVAPMKLDGIAQTEPGSTLGRTQVGSGAGSGQGAILSDDQQAPGSAGRRHETHRSQSKETDGARSWDAMGSHTRTTYHHSNGNGDSRTAHKSKMRSDSSQPVPESTAPWIKNIEALLNADEYRELGVYAIEHLNGQFVHHARSRLLNLALNQLPGAKVILLSEKCKIIAGGIEKSDSVGLGPATAVAFFAEIAKKWHEIASEYDSLDPKLIKAGKIARMVTTCFERAYWSLAHTAGELTLTAASGYPMMVHVLSGGSAGDASSLPSVTYLQNDTRAVFDAYFNFVTDADEQWLLVKMVAQTTRRSSDVLATKLSTKHNLLGQHSILRRP